MQISTLFYQIRKIIGVKKSNKADEFLVTGLSEMHQPKEQSIKNIMAFSNAYHFDKSEAIGDIEYLIN